MQRRHDPPRQLPIQFNFVAVERLPSVERQPALPPHAIERLRHPIADDEQILPRMFDEEQCLGLGRHEQVVFRIIVARQTEMPPIEQIASARGKRQNLLHGQGRIFERVEEQHADAAMRRQRLGGQRRFGDKGECSLASGQQSPQIQIARLEHVAQLIAALVERRFRLIVADHAGVPRAEIGQAADKFLPPRGRSLGIAQRQRLAADLHQRAVGQHDLQAQNMPPRGAVLQPMTPRGVDRHHAPHRRHMAHRRIGTEQPADGTQLLIKLRMHYARLQSDAVGVDSQNPAHMPAEIENQPAAERFAGEPRPRPRA